MASISTERLELVPLQVEDADELVGVLADERLYAFIGGAPVGLGELRKRYARLVAGSGRPDETWLNWVVRMRADSRAIGTVQATVRGRTALVAWVIGVEWQGRGFASEAARALVEWLRGEGAEEVVANVHREHAASEVVAARAGLEPTAEVVDGERVWRSRGGGEPFEVAVADGVLRGHRGGAGPPALLLHGGPGMGDYTGGLAAELAPSLTTHRYTQRGASPSTVGPPFSVETHVADAVAVLDALGLERAWAVGHSWGAFLALHLLLAHPKRLFGVVCVGALGAFSPFAEMDPALRRGLSSEQDARVQEVAAMRSRGEATEADLLDRFGLLWPNYHADPSDPPPNPIARYGPRCSAETNAAVERHFELGTLERGLPATVLPVLFVHGGVDPLPLRTVQATAALVPGARLDVLERCGHFPWLERPGAVREAVVAFLGEAVRSGRSNAGRE